MFNIRRIFIDLKNSYPNRIQIIILILTNFVCNNLFLFNLKYYSDDWPLLVYPLPKIPFSSALLTALHDSRRPLSSVLFILGQQIADNVLLFHLLAFITTTIALIIVYYIFRRIFNDFGYENDFYPFIASMVFCTLFNKDEIFPWPTLSFGFHYIAYLLTIYLYLNKERKYYLILSCTIYLLAMLTYEVGIAIPAFLLVYDYLIGKDWKKSLYLAVPLTLYLVIRFTHWFGYGGDPYNVGFGNYGFETIIATLAAPVIASFVFLNNFINSFYGYTQMSVELIIFLFILNAVLLTIIYRYLMTLHYSNKFNTKLIYVAFLMLFVFSVPYLIRNYLSTQTREYYLIDIGISLLIVCALILFKNPINIKILVIIIIGLGLFINQGLYYNWVVSGDLLKKIDNYIGENRDNLSKYDYIYFNTRSFTEKLPNGIKYEIVPFYWTVQDIKNKLLGRPPLLKNDTQYDYGYNFYYNARALEPWALTSMIRERKNTNFTLIYGNYLGTVPVEVSRDTILYKNYGEGSIFNVSRDKVFEINYTSVVSFNRLSSNR